MAGLLSSPRKRRRLFFSLGMLAIVGLLVAVGLKWSNTAPKLDDSREGSGYVAPPQPKPARFTNEKRREALSVAAQFIDTAVARNRVGDSWALTSPSMKAGYTRNQWAEGDIPVVPFPVATVRWELDYSFTDSVGLKVALFPKKGANEKATVFLLDLRKFGRGQNARWLVENFQPHAQMTGTQNRAPKSALGFPDLGKTTGTGRLGATWLLIPFGFLSLIVLIPIAVGLLNWRRSRNAEREYLRSKTSSPAGR